jgi:hypothetical protein
LFFCGPELKSGFKSLGRLKARYHGGERVSSSVTAFGFFLYPKMDVDVVPVYSDTGQTTVRGDPRGQDKEEMLRSAKSKWGVLLFIIYITGLRFKAALQPGLVCYTSAAARQQHTHGGAHT